MANSVRWIEFTFILNPGSSRIELSVTADENRQIDKWIPVDFESLSAAIALKIAQKISNLFLDLLT